MSALRYGAQIVVGTPGRVQDHLERGTLVLNQLRICILDEADQMLDIGFAPIVEEILATTPETRQMALFSATMPDWVTKLQEKFLKDPVKVDITVAMGGESTIEQIAYQVPHSQKMAALCTLLNSTQGESSLIFGKTKFGVEKLGEQLSKLGFTVGTLHGNKSQRARDEVLNAFRRGQVQTLLATNVAARGLDIQGIYQVINYELPESSELFTHRIGRTGRMGRQGKAITLLVPSDLPKWRRMARGLGQAVVLERLTIDEGASGPTVSSRSAVVAPQESEQDREPRPERDRKQFVVNREERRKRLQPEYDSRPASNTRRRQKDNVFIREMLEVESQPEVSTTPERPYAGKERDGRRAPGRPHGNASRPAGRRNNTRSFVDTEAQPYTGGGRKSRASAPAQRPAASKRYASR
jgi:ATP-dependent RNA helicase DeaD